MNARSDSDEFLGATAPALLVERARRRPLEVAFRSKHLGIYRERTWADVCDLVARCAHGFLSLGLAAGHRVAIVAEPCEEWFVCDLAAQAVGAVSCGLFPTAADDELEGQLRDADAGVLVLGGLELLERVLPLLPKLGRSPPVICVASGASGNFLSYEQLLARGADALATGGQTGEQAVERLAAPLDPAAPAVLQFTAGSTGRFRPALISHRGQLAASRELVRRYHGSAGPGTAPSRIFLRRTSSAARAS
jgi:long-chain acyl-CoA synthetase